MQPDSRNLEIALNAVDAGPRKAMWALLSAARANGWDVPLVEASLAELAEDLLRARRSAAAAHVDRDRGIREALARSEGCATHGAEIRFESHQAYAFSMLAEAHDEERVTWLTAAMNLRDAFAHADPAKVDKELADKVVARVNAVDSAIKKIRKRYNAPTHADCQRAGRCEHPPTVPHAACRQLDLFGLADEGA
jgi:hypothetical protein